MFRSCPETFYTIAGGIEAVIWTDVIQAIVLIFGGLACFVLIAFDLPGGFSQIIAVGKENNKFSLGSFDWNLYERTFWTVAILGIINWLMIYSGDQNMVQRYAAARSTREARKATAIYSAIALPMWIMFFFVGTALFVYYATFPSPTVSALEPDQILPYFILTQVPAGVAGIIIAAVLAAAMSSLDSGINAISTVSIIDLMKPHLTKHRSDRFYLGAARIIAGVVTLVVILGAITFSKIEKESMNDVSLVVTSIFGGCLMGLFVLGFFSDRVDSRSATIAMGIAILLNIYLAFGFSGLLPKPLTVDIHKYWVSALINGTFVVVAYTISRIRNSKPLNLEGLTVWTPPKQ